MNSQEPHHLPYRFGVGIMLLNRQGYAFVARRLDMPSEAWQMPQGGMEDGETADQAAFRELKEEIGTNHAEIIGETNGWLTYELPADLIPKVWKGRYRGQKQKWFAMRFLGADADIDIDTEHPEFSDWKWAPVADLPDLIVPFKRRLYRELVENFAHLAANTN